jgi:hypothetical protein
MMNVVYAECILCSHKIGLYAEHHYAECRYADCLYGERRGTHQQLQAKGEGIFQNIFIKVWFLITFVQYLQEES